MIDLIFFTFFAGLFFSGFWLGAKFGTTKAMFSAVSKKFRALFD